VLFILSLPVVLRPRTFRDIFLLGLAALSPMTVYALEPANNDLVVYLLIVWASALLVVSRLYRLCSYALFLTAGLLKYYPLVLLLLLARERQQHAILAATIVGLIVISFGGNYHFELGKAPANVPSASYFTDAPSASVSREDIYVQESLVHYHRHRRVCCAPVRSSTGSDLLRCRLTLRLFGKIYLR
jgi:hypothetical protein